MSIEKLTDASKVYIEQSPYTQIFNLVIDKIKDNDAFRIFCYLSSKSRNWNVVKEWTAKQCGVGERKAKQCWSYFERCGLIQYRVLRDESGKYIKHDLIVLNGSKFDPDIPFLKPKEPTGAEVAPLVSYPQSQWCKNPPGGETTRVDSAPLLNKDLTNKDFKQKKEKSFYAKEVQKKINEKKHPFADNMNQLANEKRHIEEHFKRKAIETKKIQPIPSKKESNLFWGPGHPGWESLHGVVNNGADHTTDRRDRHSDKGGRNNMQTITENVFQRSVLGQMLHRSY